MAIPPTKDLRPPFMARLGLLPPYTEADVKQAYLENAKTAHPDRGGSAAAFHELQTAYEHAVHYVHLRTDRRAWIASQMDKYLKLQDIVGRLNERYPVEIGWDSPEWIEQSFGDFAHLIDKVIRIRLANSPRGDQMIHDLVHHQSALQHLQRLELPGSRVSDDAVLQLSAFPSLSHLDLRGTPVTSRVIALVKRIPSLQTLDLGGTSVGWWSRQRVRAALHRRYRLAGAKRAFWLVGTPSRSRPHPSR